MKYSASPDRVKVHKSSLWGISFILYFLVLGSWGARHIINVRYVNWLTDAGENGTNWPVYFLIGAESYSSLGHVGKKEKKIAWDILAKFACGQVSSPRLCRLTNKFCILFCEILHVPDLWIFRALKIRPLTGFCPQIGWCTVYRFIENFINHSLSFYKPGFNFQELPKKIDKNENFRFLFFVFCDILNYNLI